MKEILKYIRKCFINYTHFIPVIIFNNLDVHTSS